MARPAKWNSPTESVRLPAHLIPRLTELAQTLDQPIPETVDTGEFQEYASFVQNLAPMMATITDAQGEKRYLIDPELISFDEFKSVQQTVDELMASLEAEGFTRKEDRLFIFMRLVEAWGTPIRLPNRVKGGHRYADE